MYSLATYHWTLECWIDCSFPPWNDITYFDLGLAEAEAIRRTKTLDHKFVVIKNHNLSLLNRSHNEKNAH